MKELLDGFFTGTIPRRKFIGRVTAGGLAMAVLGKAPENEVGARLREQQPAAGPGGGALKSIHDTKGRVVRFDAKPEPIAIDTATTAVIVVDMQNDFGAKGGMFDRAGIDISGIQKVINPTANVLASARDAGIKVVYLKMAFRPDLSDLGAPDSPSRLRHLPFSVGKTVRAPDGKKSRILIRDTWNTDIVPELKPQADDVVVYKNRFSGFYQTDLDAILKQLGVKYLIVTGCTTSVCVEATVRDAMYRDYVCVSLMDCMSQPTLGTSLPGSNHNASLVLTEVCFGWVSSSEQFIKALEVQPIVPVQEKR